MTFPQSTTAPLPLEVYTNIPDEHDTLLRQDTSPKPPEDSQHEHKKNSDFFAFTLLGLLYFIQGLPLGFFGDALTFIFTAKGASFTDLSKLTLILYPYGLKLFFAPLQDTMYFKKFGKRKTYIIPSLLGGGITSLIVSFYIQNLVDEMQINTLVIIGFIVIAFMALEDIAVDGWIVSLISKENFSVGGAFQRIIVVLLVGTLTGFNLFIPLNSVEFSNKYFYSTPSDRPIITLQEFCLFMGIISIVTALALIPYKEKKPKEEYIVTFKELVFMFRQFATNRSLRIFVILLLFSYIGVAPASGIFQPIMIQHGFKKEDFTNILTITIPFQFLAISFGAYLSRRYKNENLLYTVSLVPLVLTNFLAYWIISNQSDLTYAKLSLLIFFQQVLWGMLQWFGDGCWTSYVLKITHESTASTFITTIYSFSNVAIMWPKSLALAITDAVSAKVVIIATIVLGALYVPAMVKYYLPLQKKTAEDYGFHKEIRQDIDNPVESDVNTGNSGLNFKDKVE